MTRIGDYAPADFAALLATRGIRLESAGLALRVWSDIPEIADHLGLLYADHALLADEGVDDYRLRIQWDGALQRVLKRRVAALTDGRPFFAPLPRNLSPTFVEGCLNWSVAFESASYVIVHGAVVERDGLATIMPADSGSGKSTLCAALAHRGWRLLSDELTILRPADLQLISSARPVSLKNAAIDLIRGFAPEARFGPVLRGGTKGDVAFMRPPADAVMRVGETAAPAFVISPRYQEGAEARLTPVTRAEAFRMMVDGTVLYRTSGRRGFETACRIAESCPAYRLSYSRLDDALELIGGLYAARCAPAPVRAAAASGA